MDKFTHFVFLNHPAQRWRIKGTAIVVAIACISGFLTPAHASDPRFGGDGIPHQTRGGASRGDDCPETVLPITPILPAVAQGGWTTEVNPTVWVYVPFSMTSEYEVKFELKDSQNQTLYQTWLSDLSTGPGVLQFSVPATVSLPETPVNIAEPDPLLWRVSVFCDPMGGRPDTASGVIRRVDRAIATPESDSPLMLSEAYVQNGIWYDALTVLGDARLENPDDPDLEAAWQTLLSYDTVGLEAIATEPLLDCCTLSE